MHANISDKVKLDRMLNNIKTSINIPLIVLLIHLFVLLFIPLAFIGKAEEELNKFASIWIKVVGFNILALILSKILSRKEDKYIKSICKRLKHIKLNQYSIEAKVDTLDKWNYFEVNELENYVNRHKETLLDYKKSITDILDSITEAYSSLFNHLNNTTKLTYIDKETVYIVHNLYNEIYDKCLECNDIGIKVIYKSIENGNIYSKESKINIDELLHIKNNKESTTEEYKETKIYNIPNKKVQEALSLYMLTLPFTLEQLKERKRSLSKAFHPDNNNSLDAESTIKKINQAYDLLEPYASK